MLYFIGIALIAFLYSIVGHAGASGYIACMVIFDKPVSLIKPTALILNLAASTLNSIRFCGDGHLKKYTLVNFLIPILLVSIPSTIVGGQLNITDTLLRYFLSLILFLSGIRFLITSLIIKNNTITDYKLPSKIVIFFTGSILGLLSGITGTGGGIFLTPLSILLKWMPLKTTAAASSVFIFFNSLVGIITWQIINNFSNRKRLHRAYLLSNDIQLVREWVCSLLVCLFGVIHYLRAFCRLDLHIWRIETLP